MNETSIIGILTAGIRRNIMSRLINLKIEALTKRFNSQKFVIVDYLFKVMILVFWISTSISVALNLALNLLPNSSSESAKTVLCVIFFIIPSIFAIALMIFNNSIKLFENSIEIAFDRIFKIYIVSRLSKYYDEPYFNELLSYAEEIHFHRFMNVFLKSGIRFASISEISNFRFDNLRKNAFDGIIEDCINRAKLYNMQYEYKNSYNRRTTNKAQNTTTFSNKFSYFGFTQRVPKEELKKAYYKKIKTLHPDNGGSVKEFLKAKDLYEELLKTY